MRTHFVRGKGAPPPSPPQPHPTPPSPSTHLAVPAKPQHRLVQGVQVQGLGAKHGLAGQQFGPPDLHRGLQAQPLLQPGRGGVGGQVGQGGEDVVRHFVIIWGEDVRTATVQIGRVQHTHHDSDRASRREGGGGLCVCVSRTCAVARGVRWQRAREAIGQSPMRRRYPFPATGTRCNHRELGRSTRGRENGTHHTTRHEEERGCATWLFGFERCSPSKRATPLGYLFVEMQAIAC